MSSRIIRPNGSWTGSNGVKRVSLQEMIVHAESIADFRNLAPLPSNAERLFDKVLLKVGTRRMTLVKDLIANGQVMPIADPLGTMMLYHEKISRTGAAQMSMVPRPRPQNRLPDREGVSVPIYFTTDDFSISARELRASQRAGSPLDTSNLEDAVLHVNETIENAAWNGCGFAVNGNTAYGVLNHPDVNLFQFGTSGELWSASGHSGDDIVQDTLGMIQLLHDAKKYGPYNLYVPTAVMVKLNEDYSATKGEGTILDRLNKITVNDERPIRVRVADFLPAGNVALMEMSNSVMDMVIGQEATVLSWDRDGSGFDRDFMVMACAVPRVKSDYSGNSGIVVGQAGAV